MVQPSKVYYQDQKVHAFWDHPMSSLDRMFPSPILIFLEARPPISSNECCHSKIHQNEKIGFCDVNIVNFHNKTYHIEQSKITLIFWMLIQWRMMTSDLLPSSVKIICHYIDEMKPSNRKNWRFST